MIGTTAEFAIADSLVLLYKRLYAKYFGITLSFGTMVFICWLNANSPSSAMPIFPILPMQVTNIASLVTTLAFSLAASDMYSLDFEIYVIPASAIPSGFTKQISSLSQYSSLDLLGVFPVITVPNSPTEVFTFSSSNPNLSIFSHLLTIQSKNE